MILVLAKAMNILELLSRNIDREVPLSEIADTLNMDRGTCTNILKSLSSRGYVQQIGPRQGYKLGYMVYYLTNSPVANDELTGIARDDIMALGATLNESAILSVIRNDKRVVLLHSLPERDVLIKAHIDKSVYSANTGRVILANYPLPDLEKFILRKGLPTREEWPGIFNSDNPSSQLMHELVTIKRNGYSISTDTNNTIGFAAPVFKDGHVAGSVGVYLPTHQVDDSDAILKEVLDCAESINHKMNSTHTVY